MCQSLERDRILELLSKGEKGLLRPIDPKAALLMVEAAKEWARNVDIVAGEAWQLRSKGMIATRAAKGGTTTKRVRRAASPAHYSRASFSPVTAVVEKRSRIDSDVLAAAERVVSSWVPLHLDLHRAREEEEEGAVRALRRPYSMAAGERGFEEGYLGGLALAEEQKRRDEGVDADADVDVDVPAREEEEEDGGRASPPSPPPERPCSPPLFSPLHLEVGGLRGLRRRGENVRKRKGKRRRMLGRTARRSAGSRCV